MNCCDVQQLKITEQLKSNAIVTSITSHEFVSDQNKSLGHKNACLI